MRIGLIMCDNQVPESEKGSSDACGKLAYRIGSTFFGYVRFQLWPDLYPWLGSNYFLRVLFALLIGALCYLLHVLGERKPELSSRASKSPSLARTVSGDSTPRTHLQSIGLITFKKLQRLQTTVWSGIMPSAYHQYYAFYSDLNYILQATWRFAVGRDPCWRSLLDAYSVR